MTTTTQALKAAAEACEGWSWPDRKRDENGTHHFGQRREGEFYEIGTIDASTYTGEYVDDLRVLKFIRLAQPKAILSLIAELEQLRAEKVAMLGGGESWVKNGGSPLGKGSNGGAEVAASAKKIEKEPISDSVIDRFALEKCVCAGDLPADHCVYKRSDVVEIIRMLRAASAKPVEQEPVAWGILSDTCPKLTNDQVLGNYWERKGCKVTPLYAAPQAPQAAPGCLLTQDQVSKMARYVSDFSSTQCGVDKDDAWKIYGNDEISVMRDALKAAGIEVKP